MPFLRTCIVAIVIGWAASAAADRPFVPVTRDIDVVRYEIAMAVAELRAAPIDIALTMEAKALRDIRLLRLDIEPQKIAIDAIQTASAGRAWLRDGERRTECVRSDRLPSRHRPR
jgi:hypothetical protein